MAVAVIYNAHASVKPQKWRGMAISTPVGEHIRLMESRIKQQTTLVQRLKQSGQDASEASRRLVLLEGALREMRAQFCQLAPTEMDWGTGRPKRGQTRNRPVRKK